MKKVLSFFVASMATLSLLASPKQVNLEPMTSKTQLPVASVQPMRKAAPSVGKMVMPAQKMKNEQLQQRLAGEFNRNVKVPRQAKSIAPIVNAKKAPMAKNANLNVVSAEVSYYGSYLESEGFADTIWCVNMYGSSKNNYLPDMYLFFGTHSTNKIAGTWALNSEYLISYLVIGEGDTIDIVSGTITIAYQSDYEDDGTIYTVYDMSTTILGENGTTYTASVEAYVESAMDVFNYQMYQFCWNYYLQTGISQYYNYAYQYYMDSFIALDDKPFSATGDTIQVAFTETPALYDYTKSDGFARFLLEEGSNMVSFTYYSKAVEGTFLWANEDFYADYTQLYVDDTKQSIADLKLVVSAVPGSEGTYMVDAYLSSKTDGNVYHVTMTYVRPTTKSVVNVVADAKMADYRESEGDVYLVSKDSTVLLYIDYYCDSIVGSYTGDDLYTKYSYVRTVSAPGDTIDHEFFADSVAFNVVKVGHVYTLTGSFLATDGVRFDVTLNWEETYVDNVVATVENGYQMNVAWDGTCYAYYVYVLKGGSTTIDSTTILGYSLSFEHEIVFNMLQAGSYRAAIEAYYYDAVNGQYFVLDTIYSADVTISAAAFDDAPTNLDAVSEANENQFDVTFTWNGNGEATDYLLRVEDNKGESVLDLPVDGQTSAQLTLDSGFYYVSVYAVDAMSSIYTKPATMELSCGTSYAIENLSVDNIIIDENNVTISFSWDMEDAANHSFGLFVYDSYGYKLEATKVDSVNAYACTLSLELDEWGDFTWGVCVVDTNGAKLSSTIMGDTFTINNPYIPYELEGDLMPGSLTNSNYFFSWSMDSLCSYFWYTITDSLGTEIEDTYLEANSYVENGYGVEFNFEASGTYTFTVYAGYLGDYYTIYPLSEEVSCQVVVNYVPTDLDNVAADAKAEKFIENGQVLIRQDGKVFNTAGIQVR